MLLRDRRERGKEGKERGDGENNGEGKRGGNIMLKGGGSNVLFAINKE